jgi:tetratricopeptide (TPR) repeat protein
MVETQVAGSEVQGSARMVEVPANAADEQTANDLAAKYSELGDFYFRANRFNDASAAYGKARAYAPSDAQLHFVLADAAFAGGDYPYAAFLIGEGLRLDPALATATTDKRTFYGDGKTFAEQQATLDAYVAKKPYDALAHLVRGYNLRFSGDAAGAKAAFERVLQIDPENRPAKTFLAGMAPNEPADGTR